MANFIDWKGIFDQIRAIIAVLTKRFFQVKEWVDAYTEESSTAA